MGSAGRDRRAVFQFVGGQDVSTPGRGLKVDPPGGALGAFPDGPFKREVRLGEGDQTVGEALVKLDSRLDAAVTWAAMSGLVWQRVRAASADQSSSMPWKRST